jgi:hypothetical protein
VAKSPKEPYEGWGDLPENKSNLDVQSQIKLNWLPDFRKERSDALTRFGGSLKFGGVFTSILDFKDYRSRDDRQH